ncbi:MAG: leucine--tRNA ligase [Porphyromonas sp.]|nr:leucine--tRNA ligase [Porphyromonas sp.]
MEYNFRHIESHWQEEWRKQQIYKVQEDASRPAYYVLDMFPYPSGAGLHVGHPLGYIASDIFARYKRLRGFNVLHPMGYDAFGLPAEQYAIQTGQHPAKTTEVNTARYREQLDKIGFSYDWSREFRTSDPSYYKWTQWAFVELFNAYYDKASDKARPIAELIAHFEARGTEGITAAAGEELNFTAEEWRAMSPAERSQTLMNYRLAYLGETMVNWCAALGTVLANDEVVEGLSARGGHPVEQKLMRQWCLRVSAYAERLLGSLDALEWSDALKETQRNWIGRSEGAELRFRTEQGGEFTVFTTRPDTIYGVTFMVLAPESELVAELTKPEQQTAVEEYLQATKRKTERERIADRRVSGVFTGSYAINPITEERIPIWVSDYVLAGYGTGAIMAVPAHDSRDFAFARHFGLPIRQVVLLEGESESNPAEWSESKDSKAGTLVNSSMLDGLSVLEAQARIKAEIEARTIGRVKVNYRLRDAIFSRQRYWGEPFPVYYREGLPETLTLDQLPLCLPDVDKFLPTESGEPPLGRAEGWHTAEGFPYELNTMPGFAGSSAYYLRYMDPHNSEALVSPEANQYWRQVDLYVGGTEHATGHLIYSRFWNKFLYDLGVVCEDEPFRRLVNQGMIQGRSNFVYRIKGTNTFVSYGLRDNYDVQPLHVDVNIVSNDKLDLEAFKAWQPDYHNAEFILEDGQYICGWAVEKMSKSMHNVVNPDTIIERYGADTLRLYEMFLGPLEQSKPWDTNGIDGVHRFLRKLWSLFWSGDTLRVVDEPASKDELKALHKLIKKATSDIEGFSFNTSISAFMICVNDFTSMGTKSREALQPLLILLSPYAPHIAEELWHAIGGEGSIITATWPECNEAYLVEDSFTYPVSFNGKTRFTIELAADLAPADIEAAVLASPEAERWLEGKTPKKVIVVPKRIVNIVL